MAKACVATGTSGGGTDASGGGTDACSGAGIDDERSRDEIRADIFGDLLLGGGPVASGDGLSAISAQVQISIPVLTAAGVSDRGAELIGSGPLDAETARHLVGAASGWDRVMTCPVTGTILAVDRYRPSEEIRRALRVRDEHCRFPGCRQPAHRCDADHSITHQGHGVLEWTSPSGRTYVDTPTPTLRFFPTGPDDPGHDPNNPGADDPGHDPNGPDPGPGPGPTIRTPATSVSIRAASAPTIRTPAT